MTGSTGDDRAAASTGAADDRLAEAARSALREILRRAAIASRLAPPAGDAVLRSIVEATVALFDAEAASLALYDPGPDRLVFLVAAGDQGAGVVGLTIRPDEGVAGYVFTTGQPLALADVGRDARFGRDAAERTGYVPRSIVAVPLLDDEGAIGVMEVLDKRSAGGFDLRDVELATVFARQAAVAIRAGRLERDVRTLVRDTLTRLAAAEAGVAPAGGAERERRSGAIDPAAVEAIVADAARSLDGEDDTLWAITEEIARIRSAEPAELGLVRELLEVLARRAERASDARSRRRGRGAGT